jgi:hypothetical protein
LAHREFRESPDLLGPELISGPTGIGILRDLDNLRIIDAKHVRVPILGGCDLLLATDCNRRQIERTVSAGGLRE